MSPLHANIRSEEDDEAVPRPGPQLQESRPRGGSGGNASVVLQRLTARAPHAMAVTGGAAHLLQNLNPAFCRLMGVEPEQVLGRSFAEAFPGESHRAALDLLDRVFRSGKAEEAQEMPGTRSGADRVIWSYTVWPLDNGAGEPAGLIVEVSDHTERAESRQRLEEMADLIRQINERLLRSALQEQEWAEKAEAANRAKSDFLAMMSHELRTPLTGIVAYTDLLEAHALGPITERQRESLARIKSCSNQLLDLIQDVLSFAKAEARTDAVQLERVDLGKLAEEAAAVIEPAALQKGLDFRISTPATPLTTETDPRKVKQILLNLLSNAVKFTDEGEVRLEVVEDRGSARLVVSDTGIGIAGADLERIFEPFVQAEAVTTRRFGGTGLGLAISRSLTLMLGGKLSVRSTPGKGTVFSVDLLPPPPADLRH